MMFLIENIILNVTTRHGSLWLEARNSLLDLVGDISRWNQGKMQEWAERTVSSINGEYSPENKALVEHKKRVLREEYLNTI